MNIKAGGCMDNKIAVGIDCGGTNLRAARVENDQIVTDIIEEATPNNLDLFNQTVHNLIERLKPEGWDKIAVGLSLPGMVDYNKQKVFYCPNLKFLNQTPVGGINEHHMLHIGNDADMSLLGELVIGNLWDQEVGLITLGTGVGSAYYIGRTGPWQTNLESEIGHSKVDIDGERCSCGGLGCLETKFSGWALAGKAIGKDIMIESVAVLFEKARDGNKDAEAIIFDGSRYLGVAIANLVNVIGLSKVIITGKIAKSMDIIMPELDKFFRSGVFLLKYRDIDLVQSSNIDKAPIIGAAHYALEQEL